MAEVRLCFGRGAYDSSLKISNRNNLRGQHKRLIGAAEVSYLTAGFQWGDSQHGDLCGAHKAADTETSGLSRDFHTRITPVFGAVSWDRGNVEPYSYFRLKEYPPSAQTQVFLRTFSTSVVRHLFWRQAVFIRTYSGNNSRFEPLYKSKTGYYDVLEVSPTATQAQIKTAYYKQSFVYHPDRNSGSELATTRFSDISEAYTVLGNKALRKKYDRGLLSPSDLTATARPSGKDAAAGTARQQPESRRPVMGEHIRRSTFDFDEFYKSHYSEQLQRQRDARVRKEETLKRKHETLGEKKLGSMTELGVAVLLTMGIGLLFSLKRA